MLKIPMMLLATTIVGTTVIGPGGSGSSLTGGQNTNTPGSNMQIITSDNGSCDINDILGQMGIRLPGNVVIGNGSDCQNGIIIGGNPGITLPDLNIPDISLPDAIKPVPDGPEVNGPDNNKPDENVPDNNKPDQNLPDNNKPDQNLPNTDGSENQTPDEDSQNASFAQQVVNLVNKERAAQGLSALSVDTSVQKAAQTRAKEIVSSFSHTRPDGKAFSTALTEAGVSFRGAGENIAWGQMTPEAVMNAWMNSSGHRANILNKDFTSIGVGYYVVGGTPYWTQLFTY